MSVGGFSGVKHARNWLHKHFGGYASFARGEVSGTGRNSRVLLQKNKRYHEHLLGLYRERMNEITHLRQLSSSVKSADFRSSCHQAELLDNCEEDALGPAAKRTKFSEIEVVDLT